MAQDVFDTTTNPTTDTSQPTPADPQKDYVSDLVGEGKKFASVEDLARGKAESDAFIEQLKAEQRELRDDLNQRLTVEEVLTNIRKENEELVKRSTQTTSEPSSQSIPDTTTSTQSVDVDKLIDEKLSTREKQVLRDNNYRYVNDEMVKRFGATNAPNVLKLKAAEMGVDMEYMKDLAINRPEFVLNLVGTPTTERTNVSSGGTVNTAGLDTQQQSNNADHMIDGQPTAAYFKALKEKDPKAYFSPENQLRKHKAALALGDRYLNVP